jgi:hypothetical protein
MRSRVLLLMVLLVSMVVGLSIACSPGEVCVETLDEGTLTETSATLCGRLTGDYDSGTTVGFTFWQTDVYLQEQNPAVFTADNSTDLEAFYYDVANLRPGTSYSYKAWAREPAKDKVFGDTVLFTTDAQSTSTVLATGGTTNLTSSSVTLHGEVVAIGSASSLMVEIQVGTAPGALGSVYTVAGTIQAPGAFSVDLSGLNPDTTYYYRAAGTSISAVVTPGEEKSFKTLV